MAADYEFVTIAISIYCIIQTNFKGFNISEIIKAGSLGDGTAVPGHYDIDLVIYSRGIIVKNFNSYTFTKNSQI